MTLLPLSILIPFLFIILALLIKSSHKKSILAILFAAINFLAAGYILLQVNKFGMLKAQMGS